MKLCLPYLSSSLSASIHVLLSRTSIIGVCATVCFLSIQAIAYAANITIDTVYVGNAGNAPDDTGLGAVDYDYRIGTYEVTNAQYAAFLNAKAASDPLELYHPQMDVGSFGGIIRSGSSGSYSYAPISGRENRPVIYVSWYNTLRFANWLHNGQGTGDTETGAYTILGDTPKPSNDLSITLSITRNAGAKWWVPDEDEWYKAAYHKNDGVTGNYYLFPTSSDDAPTAEGPSDGSNSANYDHAVSNLTDVGAYINSISPYGTFDQGGNVWEWSESLAFRRFGISRGGAFLTTDVDDLIASQYSSTRDFPSYGFFFTGFRVATVPEPSTLVLAVMAVVCGIVFCRRRR